MSDEIEAATETAKDDAKWTIRGMDPADRQAAVAAARRADMTVSEWLGLAIRAYITQERGEVYGTIETATALIANPGLPSLDQIDRVLTIAKEIAALRNKPVPRALLLRANNLLKTHVGIE